MYRFLRKLAPVLLLLLPLISGRVALGQGRAIEAILESAGARFVFNHTAAGRAFVEELIGARLSSLETHSRLLEYLRLPGRQSEARAIAERLRRMEGAFAEEFPLEGPGGFSRKLSGLGGSPRYSAFSSARS